MTTPPASRPKVLLADDDPRVVDQVRRALDASRYEVLVARNGQEAIDLAIRERPGVILLDVVLPGLDGFTVCQRLRSEPSTRALPIILYSAAQDEKQAAEAFQVGAQDYLTKPFTLSVLRSRVHVWLNRSAQALATD